jgi:uncharacterized protein YbjT (DUF2867 family)
MRILLTGSTGYIAQRLLPVLLGNGHEVICCVRDRARFDSEKYRSTHLSILEVDFLKTETLQNIPVDIDAAYYLIHSMSTSTGDFEKMEEISGNNFKDCIQQTKARQVIYLSGIVNEEILSKHLTSRRNVERILGSGFYSLTTLRAGIIIGSGSASFEIIRDIVEKLPLMIAPRWLNTCSQPIAIRNVIEFLFGVLLNEKTFNHSYDIGGPDICKENNLKEILGIVPLNYEKAILEAFEKIEMNQVQSSWKDALTFNTLNDGISKYAQVPVNGCFFDHRKLHVSNSEESLKKMVNRRKKRMVLRRLALGNSWFYR